MGETITHYFSVLLLCLFVVGNGVVAQGSAAADQPDDADLVHLGDIVEVDVEGSLEFDWRGGLNPEGFLDGIENVDSPVFALCRSESDLAAAVAKEYSRILREPKVKVRILDRSNRAVTYLDGAVRVPHRFQIKRSVRLNELIVLSGGITDTASGEVSIFRPKLLSCKTTPASGTETFVKASQEAGSETLTVKISDLLLGKKEANPEILSGDVVNVSQALPIYVIGGVNNPRQISARSQTTLSRAVAAAGGASKEGDESNVTIFRREGGESRVIEKDLRKIADSRAEDPLLRPYDIVEVAQRGRPKRRFPPVIDSRGDRAAMAKLPLRIIE